MKSEHLSDHDLERYHLGMVTGAEIGTLEEHYLGCPECAQRMMEAVAYVDAMRAAIIRGGYDLFRD
jgi:anti-sigma factor RsiW